ncbi:glycosyltransferase family 4 protein [Marihabitans asiaticum]|uniref:D-inositol 3-phosphate glycosyltransferase n=1 Tax=Marihabitans asiaticum TaxID=415218 RepID=A0A560WAT1_9MICO|nr:glycosyltransferase family 4 protein [Marihabitans asiaticum]TWD14739.1 glycosyltransferase involved in cell wall biosynthesis [Marihabitans asiaticum]
MRIAFLSWRDSTHPEGGGAEHYAERVCEGLGALGHDVTLFCAAHDGAPTDESRRGYRVHRAGGRFSVYAASLLAMRAAARRDAPFDVVVDTQNGVPFWAPLVTRTPVVVLVHHVHREQWPVIFGPLLARLGWLVESRVAPHVYRHRRYVVVSAPTRDELVDLGVADDRIRIIHNGTDTPRAMAVPRAAAPTLVVLGRLVPHKRVEHAIDLIQLLRGTHPDLRLRIIGEGWWHDRLVEHARLTGQSDVVTMTGYLSEEDKHAELARAWVAIAPSIKEGWGLTVVDAATHGVPTVAYHGTGGLEDSIVDGTTGVLVEDFDAMVDAVDTLLTERETREQLGEAARAYAAQFSWSTTVQEWDDELSRVIAADGTQDP